MSRILKEQDLVNVIYGATVLGAGGGGSATGGMDLLNKYKEMNPGKPIELTLLDPKEMDDDAYAAITAGMGSPKALLGKDFTPYAVNSFEALVDMAATCALAFNTLMLQLGVSFPFWLSCVIWGVVMFITAVYGVKWMAVLNYIAVPLLVILCAYGGIYAIDTAGWGTISSAVSENLMPLSAAVSTVIGLFALGATCNSDYTRYCKTRSDVVKATAIGVMPAALLMIMVGAIMAIGTGNFDVTSMFAGLGLPIVAMLVLILATWTTNTGNAYMSGLAVCKMFSVKDSKRPLATFICGALGIVCAVAGLADFLNTYISIIGAVVPPIMGVVICDYYVICKGKKENWAPVRGINWIGILAWILGGGFALLETLGVVSVFSSALDGVILSFVAYWILHSLLKNTKLAGSGEMTIEEACSVAQ